MGESKGGEEGEREGSEIGVGESEGGEEGEREGSEIGGWEKVRVEKKVRGREVR